MLNVNAYTTGLYAPSARYRIRQLIPYLEKNEVYLNEIYSNAGAFPPSDRSKHLSWAVRNISQNLLRILSQPGCDITLLQKAMLSKYYTFEGFLRKPMVFDVDDAIFLDNGGDFTRKIAKQAQKIICGNSFLAEYFLKYNNNVDIIPTSVDVSKYDAIEVDKDRRNVFYILWTGTSSGYPFVYKIEKVLKRIIDKYDFVKIKIVSDSPPKFSLLNQNDFVFDKWVPEIEFSSIKSANVGIMPINNDDRSKGKCSYKMLCYMAAKIPVVVSPYGMNKEVLDLGNIGYGAISDDDWYNSLEQIISSSEKQQQLSTNAYDIVKKNFDVNIIADQLCKSLKYM
jgi:glycosyltransferase involved in cell wall biosynthesis